MTQKTPALVTDDNVTTWKTPTNHMIVLHLSPLVLTFRGHDNSSDWGPSSPYALSKQWEGSGSGPWPRFPRALCLSVSLKQLS